MKQVRFTRQEAADPPVGVFDAALLPRAMGIAEECVDAERIAQFVMQGEFGAIVLGQGAAEFRRQRREPGAQLGGGWFGFAAGKLWLGFGWFES